MKKKIKQRAGWSIYYQPLGPLRPNKPEKEYEIREFKETEVIDSGEVGIRELEIPKGKSVEDLVIMGEGRLFS